MQIGQRFAANLRRTRRAKDLTQEALGEAAGLHRTEVGLLENSKRDPRLTTIAKLAEALETTPSRLLSDGVADEPLVDSEQTPEPARDPRAEPGVSSPAPRRRSSRRDPPSG
jgi:transcriptional regulator with XRE-family HTH domain